MRQPPASREQRKEVTLTETEMKTFGNRCPKGYIKTRILGKGGVAVVWLGKKDGRSFAMKQFPRGTSNKYDPSAYVELQMA